MSLRDYMSLKEAIMKAKKEREDQVAILNKALAIIDQDENWEVMLRVQSII